MDLCFYRERDDSALFLTEPFELIIRSSRLSGDTSVVASLFGLEMLEHSSTYIFTRLKANLLFLNAAQILTSSCCADKNNLGNWYTCFENCVSQEAEKMVAYLQDGGVDDDRIAVKTSEKPKPAGLPLTHEAALKWFYKDPQGEIQGEARSNNLICTRLT